MTPGTEHIKKILEKTVFWRVLHGEKIPQKVAVKEVRVQSSRQVTRKTDA